MVIELDSGSSGLGSNSGRGHKVFLVRHLNIIVPHSTQVHKWVLVN